MNKIFIDSFSGAAADLKKGERAPKDILAVLDKYPRVSTWDMSELIWLRSRIEWLEKEKLIISVDEEYPWHRYELTDAGRKYLNEHTI